tara:strand:- start:4178 stop:4471 length:294 start_codon:yes stop_codon:yes gene_type:complete
MEIALFFVFICILWIFSVYLLSYWKYVYWYAFFNIILIVIYFSVNILGKDYFWGHDEYGLGVFFRLMISVVFHTILGFIFSIYKSYTLRENEKSIEK